MKLGIILVGLMLATGCLCDHWKNVCTKGRDPSFMNWKQYMEVFAAGPCSPTIIIPGILATTLRVEIHDCEALKAADPDTFAKCGWTSCSGKYCPNSEYQIWIPAPISPMTILTPTEKSKDCFAGLIGGNF